MGRSFIVSPSRLSGERAAGMLAALVVMLVGATARGTPSGSDPALPPSEPPNVAPTAPGFDGGEDRPIFYTDERAVAPPPRQGRSRGIHAWIGAQTFLVQDKVMPGLDLRIGQRPIWFDLEGSFVWSSERAPELDSSFLGNHFAASLMVAPFRYRWFELRAGLGGDFFPLWNVDANEWQRAFTVKTSAHWRLWPRLEMFGTARAFAVRSDGLELGTTRGGNHGLPVLFSLGLAWRTE